MAEGSGELFFICHMGFERSRAASRAYNELGVSAGHFVGGTEKLVKMSDREIEQNIPKGSRVILIYDQGSPQEEFDRKQEAIERLTRLGVKYTLVDTMQLEIMLLENGKRLSDYLY